MSNRWSLIKRFGPITHKDFLLIGRQFCHLVKQHHRRTSKTIVTLYKELPHSVIDPEEETAEQFNVENHKKVLAVFTAIEDVPRGLFDFAENVQVVVSPDILDNSSNVCGYMECKGLLSHHMVFSVWPDRIGDYVRELCLSNGYRPSKLWFGEGDGYEELIPHSPS